MHLPRNFSRQKSAFIKVFRLDLIFFLHIISFGENMRPILDTTVSRMLRCFLRNYGSSYDVAADARWQKQPKGGTLPQSPLPLKSGPVRIDNVLFVSSDKASIAAMGTEHMRIMLSRTEGSRLVPINIRFAETAEDAIRMAGKADLAIVQFTSIPETQELIGNLLKRNIKLKVVVFAPDLDFYSLLTGRDARSNSILSSFHVEAVTNGIEPENLQRLINDIERGPAYAFASGASSPA